MLTAFSLELPPGFDLATVVCSYGFFMLAPNRWLPARDGKAACFKRPLVLAGGAVTRLHISQPAPGELAVALGRKVRQAEVPSLKKQVVRMLRLTPKDDAAVAGFQALHGAARAEGWGRLLRSPSAWEDAVKSVLLCCCGWRRTLHMNAALCAEVGGGAFPSPAQVAAATPTDLAARCGLGYRAKMIHVLAQQVVSGEVDLDALDDSALPTPDLLRTLLGLSGLGPFTAANMLQLLGRYEQVACDSETVRHLATVRGVRGCTSANVQQHAAQVYGQYAPYQFLAYWHEVWREYEHAFGSFPTMEAATYSLFTGANMRKSRGAAASAGAASVSAPSTPASAGAASLPAPSAGDPPAAPSCSSACSRVPQAPPPQPPAGQPAPSAPSGLPSSDAQQAPAGGPAAARRTRAATAAAAHAAAGAQGEPEPATPKPPERSAGKRCKVA